jgi:hypothetical protein
MTIAPRKPRVYLAGKMDRWRQEIADLCCVSLEAALDPNFELDCGRFIVTGPFFISGCSHNAGIGCVDFGSLEARRQRAHALPFQRIARADFVFAYIDAGDCYGTLVELGYAHALGKPISIAFSEKLSRKTFNELWFVRQSARGVLFGWPRETFEIDLALFYAFPPAKKMRRGVSTALQG